MAVWPRLFTPTSSARLIAEAIGWMALTLAFFIGAVLVLSWATLRR